jgi:flagellar hook-associated protein 1 FlgK
MSLSAITSAAISGLQTAQTGLSTVSDNIANVDTKGYVRKVVDQISIANGGQGSGVTVQQIRLTADRFLQAASLNAASDAGAATAAQSLWDQAQAMFGDPSSDTSFFNSLDQIFSSFSTLSASPTSSAARAGALNQVSDFFSQASSLSGQLQGLSDQADRRISGDVQTVNQLLKQIDGLNVEISRGVALNNDGTASQNQQLQLIDQLSSLMDVRVTQLSGGGVSLRTTDGTLLTGGGKGPAQLSYSTLGAQAELSLVSPTGQSQLLGSRLNSGEIKGYLDLRNSELPGMASQLSELVSQTADALNAVHNNYSAVPAANQLTGRGTGMNLTTAVGGFTGATTVAVVNGAGVLQRQVDIDFTAGTMSVNGGPGAAFTPATFQASLSAALGAFGSASYTNGALSLTASAGNGMAIADGAPASQKAGRDFSSFFGLNDLVTSTTNTNYDTGLKTTDPNGFTPGGQVTLSVIGADGARITNVAVTVPPAGSPAMSDLLTALNAPIGGVGLYGSFALDANGEMSFTPAAGSGVSLAVAQDLTTRTVGGASMSNFFGLNPAARGQRTGSFSVRADIAQNPSLMALARLNLSAAAGTPALGAGDARGADALSQVGQGTIAFDAAGSMGKISQTLSDYAAGVAGAIARKAAAADSAQTSATAIANEANARRTSIEGVNLDQELLQLTTYQQAYNASARMIQAVKDLYDTLLHMTN